MIRTHLLDDDTHPIVSGIPIPKPDYNPSKKKLDRTMRALKVGDSFIGPCHRTTAYAIAKRIGITVTVRKVGDGVRIWRVE